MFDASAAASTSTSVLPSSTVPIIFSGRDSTTLTSFACDVAILLQGVHAGPRGGRECRFAAIEEGRQQRSAKKWRED